MKIILRKEWGDLLGSFSCVMDLGTSYVYERQLVETFLDCPTEYMDITVDRAIELLASFRKNTKYWVEMKK